jgi:hypothetical protein
MRIRASSNQGNALIVTMVTIGIIGTMLASYLSLTSSQNLSVTRSQMYNGIIPVAEAGIEEALTHLYYAGITNLASDGWTSNNNVFTKERTIGDGRYVVSISNLATPVIYASGYLKAPLRTNEILRTIKVNTIGGALFAKGMVAKGNIVWVGNISSDSFDSLDPAFSTNGRYDPAKFKDNGSIGSNSGTIEMGDGVIYGNAATGPSGSANNGTVGDTNWISGGNSGIEGGHYSSDMNLSFPDVTAPDTGGAFAPSSGYIVVTNTITTTNNTSSYVYTNPPPTNAIISGVWTTNIPAYPTGSSYTTTNTLITTRGSKDETNITYNATNWYYAITNISLETVTNQVDYLLTSGTYVMDELSLSGSQKMVVTGDAILYVKGEIKISGNAEIDIAVGGSLKLYAGGDAAISGNGIQNANNMASKLTILGLPTCSSFKLDGNASFTGTMYAPNADFVANGGGADRYDCVGAVIVKSVRMNGHFLFHYDEDLGRNGPRSAYIVTGWNEI